MLPSWALFCVTRPGPQLPGVRGRGEGSAPGAQPAKSNLIQQEMGLQPDKASTEHLGPLFPLFLVQTFPGARSQASGAPGSGRSSHGIWFSRKREWLAS